VVAPLELDDAPALPSGHVLLADQPNAWRAVADWMAAGVRRHEQVIRASVDQQTEDLLLRRLTDTHRLDVSALCRSGQLRQPPVEEFYAPREQESVVTSALAAGYSGVRVCGAADAALEQMSLSEYDDLEAELAALCHRYPFSALCPYGDALLRDHEDLSIGRHPVVTDSVGCVARRVPAARPRGAGHGAKGLGVELSGEFDLGNAELLRAAIARAAGEVPAGGTLAVDLSAVSFFGMAAVRAVLVGTEALRDQDGTVVIQAPDSHLDKIFGLLDLTEVSGVQMGGERR
jgi:anti-anti-sigma factor